MESEREYRDYTEKILTRLEQSFEKNISELKAEMKELRSSFVLKSEYELRMQMLEETIKRNANDAQRSIDKHIEDDAEEQKKRDDAAATRIKIMFTAFGIVLTLVQIVLKYFGMQ